MKNTINWFEIPVKDFGRAQKFYSKILGISVREEKLADIQMGVFENDSEGINGAIVKGQWYEPSDKGSLIYLNGGDDLNGVLSKVEPNGGKVVLPKTFINEKVGYFAMFMDCEGNRMALHSLK